MAKDKEFRNFSQRLIRLGRKFRNKFSNKPKHMPRRKSEENNIRKLTRSGGGKSIGLTLPIEVVRELGWKEKQKVVVKHVRGGVMVRDWRN